MARGCSEAMVGFPPLVRGVTLDYGRSNQTSQRNQKVKTKFIAVLEINKGENDRSVSFLSGSHFKESCKIEGEGLDYLMDPGGDSLPFPNPDFGQLSPSTFFCFSPPPPFPKQAVQIRFWGGGLRARLLMAMCIVYCVVM